MVPTHPHTGTALRSDKVVARALQAETRCMPPEDAAFARCVERVVAEIDAQAQRDPRTLEVRLRREYPRARVIAREVHGSDLSSPVTVRWYAFRDGAAPPAPLDYE
jgi:hypothetical protein